MVESEADGAVRRRDARRGDVRPPQMQVAINTINELVAEAGKPSRGTGPRRPANEALIAALQGRRRRPARRTPSRCATSCERSDAISGDQEGRAAVRWPPQPKPNGWTQRRPVQGIRRARIPDHARLGAQDQGPHRRPRARHRAPDRLAVGILPRVHGSSLFTRGETQAIVAVTLGTARDGQIIDAVARRVQGTLPVPLQLPALFGR